VESEGNSWFTTTELGFSGILTMIMIKKKNDAT